MMASLVSLTADDGHQAITSHKKGLFRQMDVNQDGRLSYEEFIKMPRMLKLKDEKRRKIFLLLDRDKDGKLAPYELHSHEARCVKLLKKQFKNLDLDQSGSLSFEEISALPFLVKSEVRERKRIFRRLDRNKNQQIERFELRVRHRRWEFDFAKHDTDHSQGLDYVEFSSISWCKRLPEHRCQLLFKRIDTNHDNQISPEEIKSHHKHKHRSPSMRTKNEALGSG